MEPVTEGGGIWSRSKLVGLYQLMLRRQLEHFFPEAILEAVDHSAIAGGETQRSGYEVTEDPSGLGLELSWFGTRFSFLPGRPAPFLPAEKRLIEVIVRVLDRRFLSLYEQTVDQRLDLFNYALEDYIVMEYLSPPWPSRVPAALEALRVAALSTYENRRVSSGALLLGTDEDPAMPWRSNPPGAPSYNVRLTAIKSIHRLCDGIRTLFLVDKEGDLAWAVDIARWARQAHGDEAPEVPCPRPYLEHARATRVGGHVCLVLSQAQEIKVFAEGALAFAYSDARWRLLDIPTKFAMWAKAVGTCRPANLAERLFRAALNLGEARHGALFVVLRDPGESLPMLVAPGDRIGLAEAIDDPQDPDNISPRMAKRALHHLVWGQDVGDLDDSVVESISAIDGAVVTDLNGRLLAFGAILRITPEAILAARAVEGARTVAALAASFHGPVLKVSEDGFLMMYLGGRLVWEL